MSEMKCQCGQSIKLADPPFEIANGRHTSMVVFNHGMMGDMTCPKCKMQYMGFINSFDIATLSFTVGVCPVPAEPAKSLIELAPDGFDPRKIFH